MDWLTPGLSVRGMVSFDYDSYYRKLFSAGFATYELNDRDNYQSLEAYNKFNTDGELSYSKSSSTILQTVYGGSNQLRAEVRCA